MGEVTATFDLDYKDGWPSKGGESIPDTLLYDIQTILLQLGLTN